MLVGVRVGVLVSVLVDTGVLVNVEVGVFVGVGVLVGVRVGVWVGVLVGPGVLYSATQFAGLLPSLTNVRADLMVRLMPLGAKALRKGTIKSNL